MLKMSVERCNDSTKISRGFEYLLIIGIVITSFVVYSKHWRITLPLHYNVDEILTMIQVQNLLNGVPIDFYRYGPMASYLVALVYKMYQMLFGSNTEITYLFLRYVICGLALLSNFSVYYIVRKTTKKHGLAILGYALAMFNLYVFQYLYYAGPDVMLYSMANFTFAYTVKIYFEDRYTWRDYTILGILFGMTVASKYQGVIILFVLLLFQILNKGKKSILYDKYFFYMLFISFATFCILMYSALLNFDTFLADVKGIFETYSGDSYMSSKLPLLAYAKSVLYQSWGWLGLFFSIGGLFFCKYYLKEQKQIMIICFAYLIACLIVLGKSNLILPRNMSLCASVVPIIICFFLDYLDSKRIGKVCRCIVVVTIVYAVIIEFIYTSYPESFEAAEEWIDDNIPKDSRIYCGKNYAYDPYINLEKYNVEDYGNYIELTILNDEYFVCSSYGFARLTRKEDWVFFKGNKYMNPEEANDYMDFVSKLTEVKRFESIASDEMRWRYIVEWFGPFKYSRKDYYQGPTIVIYKKE